MAISNSSRKAWNKGLRGFNQGRIVAKDIREQIRYNQPSKKEVVQYDLKGNFIAIWVSISEAAKALNLNIGNISLCCKNKIKQTGGYLWKYLEKPIFNIN